MAFLEGHRLAGQPDFLFSLLRSVVCNGKEKARSRPDGILVVKSGGIVVAAHLFAV